MYSHEEDEKIDPCFVCAAWQEKNTRLCFLCGRKEKMPRQMTIREYSEYMQARGEKLIMD